MLNLSEQQSYSQHFRLFIQTLNYKKSLFHTTFGIRFIREFCKIREALKPFKLTETVYARLNLSKDAKSKVGSCVLVYPNLTPPTQ